MIIGSETFLSTPKDENQDSTTVTIKGLEEDKTYEVRVVAVDGQYETPSELQEISSSGIITRAFYQTLGLIQALALPLSYKLILKFDRTNRKASTHITLTHKHVI